jgi:hypothetical protein
MKKIYYEKQGRKYVPVQEYDSNFIDAFPKGAHMVMCYPGGQSRRFNIDPNYAAMIAAGRVAQEAITTAIGEASKMHRHEHENTILTEEQHAAWTHFVEVMGERGRYVHYKSLHDIAEAGVKAMQEEADKLLQNVTVRKAYEKFLLVAQLTKEKID